jgi:hypothetical protein
MFCPKMQGMELGEIMSRYEVLLVVDTEQAEIDDTREAVDEYVRFNLRDAAMVDGDQIEIFESREQE